MLSMRINNAKVQCPTCYVELTTGKYQRIYSDWDLEIKEIADRDYFKLFSLFTDTNYDLVAGKTEIEVTIWNAIRWFITEPFYPPKDIPKVITINGRTLDVPEDIGELSIGQNIFLRQHIDKTKYIDENISRAIAVYLQPIYDESDFNSKRVDVIENYVLEMPIYHTHALGFFLLSRVMTDGQSSIRKWFRTKSNRIRNYVRTLLKWPSRTNWKGLATCHLLETMRLSSPLILIEFLTTQVLIR